MQITFKTFTAILSITSTAMAAAHIGRAQCKFLKCLCMCSVRAMVGNTQLLSFTLLLRIIT